MRYRWVTGVSALTLLALAGCGSTASSRHGDAGIGALTGGAPPAVGSSGVPGGLPAPGSDTGPTAQPPTATPTHADTSGPLSANPVPAVSNPPDLVITATLDPVSVGPLICPGSVHITGTVSVNKGPANVVYFWSLSDIGLSRGTPPPTYTLHFAGTGPQTKTVSTDWSIASPLGWGLPDTLYIIVPSTVALHPPLASAGVTWLYYCGGTASTPTVTSVAGCDGASPTGTFKTTISVLGGPQTVNFTWHFSDGTSSQGQIALGTSATGAASQAVTIGHLLVPSTGVLVKPPGITAWITVDSPTTMTTGKVTASCPVLVRQ